MTGRRALTLAVLVCLAGAGLVLLAAHSTWATGVVHRAAPLPSRHIALSGTALSGLPRALGLCAVAGALAIPATHRTGRVAVGAVIALAGVGAAAAAVSVAAGQPVQRGVTAWPWICVLGGVVLAVAGGTVALRGSRWAAMGSRYDTPAARRAEPRPRDPDTQMWEALDRGEDPTAREAPRPET